MTENEIAKIVDDACYQIHTRLGPGLLESVYERILEHELQKRGLSVARQVPIPVVYDGMEFAEGFKADLIVNSLVTLELKSVEKAAPVHRKQTLPYLKLTGLKLGLLINFGAPPDKRWDISAIEWLRRLTPAKPPSRKEEVLCALASLREIIWDLS
jgi:GxxExxY protein